jgi:hypothetical protein
MKRPELFPLAGGLDFSYQKRKLLSEEKNYAV